MSVALTGGCLVVACWGAWRWTESLVLRWLCRAASNAASHLVWLSFRVLWVQALDSSWCFPLYCVGKLIKASFFFFLRLRALLSRQWRQRGFQPADSRTLPSTGPTWFTFSCSLDTAIRMPVGFSHQSDMKKTHFFFFFWKGKNSFQEILRSPKQGGVKSLE